LLERESAIAEAKPRAAAAAGGIQFWERREKKSEGGPSSFRRHKRRGFGDFNRRRFHTRNSRFRNVLLGKKRQLGVEKVVEVNPICRFADGQRERRNGEWRRTKALEREK